MYFRIGELSEICNVSVKTIRFYEKESLLKRVRSLGIVNKN